MRLSASLLAVSVLFAAVVAAAAPPSALPARAPIQSTVGIEGRVIFRHPRGEPVQSVPVNDKASVVVRIADSTPDGEFVLYDLRFIAQYPGEFDLRECLRRTDGAPLTGASPLPISVGHLLPGDHQGALFETDGSGVPAIGGYRLALIAIGVLWAIPPLVWLVRRLMRKPPSHEAAPAQPVTLADQLRPLVEQAIRGTISTADRASLELLLLAYWRERLGLAAEGLDHAGAIRRLRGHEEAGELLSLLERWLHRPPRDDEVVDVSAVLARYCHSKPIVLTGGGTT